jgi:UDPglucose 6-dehydrogenase
MMLMDVRSAELTKYAANAMLASRISFMNELSRLSDVVGADIEQVRRGIGSDPRIGTDFLYAGCGWGGSCLPKDVKALLRTGVDAGIEMDILGAVQRVNERQRQLLAERVVQRFGGDLRGLCFAVWGLAFKPGTDDMREAPSRTVIDELTRRGATIRAFDPLAMPRAREIWATCHEVSFADDPLEATRGANALLVLTEWREFRSPDFEALRDAMVEPVVFDGRNLWDPELLADLGFEYRGIGRASVPTERTVIDDAPGMRLAA